MKALVLGGGRDSSNPYILTDIRGKKGQRVGVTSGRIGRIRESVLPRLEISEIPERDFTEKVFSGTWNP